MKKLLFATLLLVALTNALFASAKEKNKTLLNDLTTALKQADEAAVKTTDIFKKVSFNFNKKRIDAFYDSESNELLGFAVPMNLSDLPEGGLEDIHKKYKGWVTEFVMLYISSNGDLSYYASLKNAKAKKIAVNITTKGKAAFVSYLPYNKY